MIKDLPSEGGRNKGSWYEMGKECTRNLFSSKLMFNFQFEERDSGDLLILKLFRTMIIWRGMGIVIPFIAFLFIYLTKFILPEGMKFEINLGLGMILGGLFWWLSMWKKERQEQTIMSGNDEKLKEKLRKRNESMPMMVNLSESSLFFISVVYWHYILICGGVMILVSTLF